MAGLPAHVAAEVQEHLDSIAALWKPGAKLTLLVRPALPPGSDGDLVMTNDELPHAITALQRRFEAERN